MPGGTYRVAAGLGSTADSTLRRRAAESNDQVSLQRCSKPLAPTRSTRHGGEQSSRTTRCPCSGIRSRLRTVRSTRHQRRAEVSIPTPTGAERVPTVARSHLIHSP
jgi:hypothetical protein